MRFQRALDSCRRRLPGDVFRQTLGLVLPKLFSSCSLCISYFLNCFDKTPWSWSKSSFCHTVYRVRIRNSRMGPASNRLGSRNRKLRAHILDCKHEAEWTANSIVFKFSKPSTLIYFIQKNPYHLCLLKQCYHL